LQLVVNLGPTRFIAVAVGHAEAVILRAEDDRPQRRHHAALEVMLIAVENVNRPRLGLGGALEEGEAVHEPYCSRSNRARTRALRRARLSAAFSFAPTASRSLKRINLQ